MLMNMITGNKIVELMNLVLDKMKKPAETLPALLLNCVAIRRPGLSPYKIAAQIISNNRLLGIPDGVNPDGSPNLINQYTYNVVKCIIEAIKEDAVVQVAIPRGTIVVQTKGENAGGPLIGTGVNIMNSVTKGIIR